MRARAEYVAERQRKLFLAGVKIKHAVYLAHDDFIMCIYTDAATVKMWHWWSRFYLHDISFIKYERCTGMEDNFWKHAPMTAL